MESGISFTTSAHLSSAELACLKCIFKYRYLQEYSKLDENILGIPQDQLDDWLDYQWYNNMGDQWMIVQNSDIKGFVSFKIGVDRIYIYQMASINKKDLSTEKLLIYMDIKFEMPFQSVCRTYMLSHYLDMGCKTCSELLPGFDASKYVGITLSSETVKMMHNASQSITK